MVGTWAGSLAWIALGVISVAGLVCALAVRRRFVVVTIFGRSMWPSYDSGDRVLVRRVPLTGIRGGQVVVIQDPSGPSDNWLIKRAIAVPGDRVPSERVPLLADRPETHVPAGRLVVLGDNPRGSFDSRIVGYIPAETLLGVVVRRFGGAQCST